MFYSYPKIHFFSCFPEKEADTDDQEMCPDVHVLSVPSSLISVEKGRRFTTVVRKKGYGV